ncbi:MAG: hypothetical protein E6I87_10195 [Chloroflexi bacterium]|nr:MAG: hypothetical protein E6I87_10195 [Chloroflexota bacterium]
MRSRARRGAPPRRPTTPMATASVCIKPRVAEPDRHAPSGLSLSPTRVSRGVGPAQTIAPMPRSNLPTFLIVVCLLSVACSGALGEAKDPLAGKYIGNGSGAALEPITALTAQFKIMHPQVEFDLEDTGSDAAIARVGRNDADFGFISRDLSAAERGKVQLIRMLDTGTAIAVNASNPVQAATKDQIRDIFSGRITDWGSVGGLAGHPIRVIRRETTSSTRSSFESYIFDGAAPTYTERVVDVVESAEMYQALRSLKDGIGMVTLQVSTQDDATIRLLSLDGVAATTNNVRSGAYPIRRPVYLIVDSDPAKLKPAVQAFIEFMQSPEGARILSGF